MATNQKKNNNAILLCGHGSRSANHSINLEKIKKKIEKKVNIQTFFCFLEVNKPSLGECLSKYSGVYSKIYIFPFLIFEGNHFKEDITKLIKKYNKFNNLILIEKLSLLDEILPVTKEILKKKIKNKEDTVLVTSSSFSKDKSVSLSMEKYTNALSKQLKLSKSFFHYVGNEDEVIKKLKIIKNNNLFILLHPVFLFHGFLFSKNERNFCVNFHNKVSVTNSLMDENKIFEIVIKKLVNTVMSAN